MAEIVQLYNSVAPLRNVQALVELIHQCQNREPGLPGLGVYYGPSGFGKTTAAVFAANQFDAYQVQMKSCWTAKKMCHALLIEIGIEPRKTVADMVDQIAEELALSSKVLIIDEADFLVKKSIIEVVRDIYESSGSPVIMIGEERLPQKLQKWERVHGRVLDWVAAQPATDKDVELLSAIYCKGVAVSPALKKKVLDRSWHSIRRVSTNLARLKREADLNNANALDIDDVDDNFFFAVQAPSPRRELA